MTRDRSDEEFFRVVADASESSETLPAPSSLKARIYSALVNRQAEAAPLMSFTELKACAQRLCVFEELVRIAPVGETVKSLNVCRVCHARVLAERMENPPIFWNGCPYVQLKNS